MTIPLSVKSFRSDKSPGGQIIMEQFRQQNLRFRPPEANSLDQKFYWRTVTPTSRGSFAILPKTVSALLFEAAAMPKHCRRHGRSFYPG